jgi:hypothetical protein
MTYVVHAPLIAYFSVNRVSTGFKYETYYGKFAPPGRASVPASPILKAHPKRVAVILDTQINANF